MANKYWQKGSMSPPPAAVKGQKAGDVPTRTVDWKRDIPGLKGKPNRSAGFSKVKQSGPFSI